MAKRKREITDAKINRFIKEGRGKEQESTTFLGCEYRMYRLLADRPVVLVGQRTGSIPFCPI
ncbi:hypothetical protein [Paenibacillus polymyxa]|uniref:hypothetical protein n=1 Tax=Paenibacillus polymyxa TaxID=1406 RepID=UPI0032AF16EE